MLRGINIEVAIVLLQNSEDFCLVVDRNDTKQIATIYIEKVRFKHLGDDTVLLIVDSKEHVETVKGRLMAKKGR